jgi:hypothetical protein
MWYTIYLRKYRKNNYRICNVISFAAFRVVHLRIYSHLQLIKIEVSEVCKNVEKKADIPNWEQAYVFPLSLSKNRSQPEPNQRLPGDRICKYKAELLYRLMIIRKSKIKEI